MQPGISRLVATHKLDSLRETVALALAKPEAVALKRWSGLNPDRLKYELVFAGSDLRSNATGPASAFAIGTSTP